MTKADDTSSCPRCNTHLVSGETGSGAGGTGLGGGSRCPVCGLDLEGAFARAGKSFADTLISILPFSGGERRLGGYAIEGALSSGTRRSVLKGHAAEDPRQLVVIKAIAHDRTSPAVQGKLIDRAHRAVGVRHEGLATLLHVGVDAGLGLAYFVSEFAPGEDLAKLLGEAGTLPPADVAALGLAVAGALNALHAAGALHMDLRPAHIVLEREDGDGEAVELKDYFEDFKLGDKPGDSAGRLRLVETGFAPVLLSISGHGETAHEPIVGTPTYVAPEQARDVGAATPASDLYSLGATMFHLLTGRPPFIGDSAVGILVQHASRAAPPVKSLAPAVPDELARVTDSLLEKSPAKRPAAQEVAAALRAFTAEDDEPAEDDE